MATAPQSPPGQSFRRMPEFFKYGAASNPRGSFKAFVDMAHSIQPRIYAIFLTAIVVLGLSIRWLFSGDSYQAGISISQKPPVTDSLLDDTQNSTLGFERLLVINFPDRTDRSDKMSLMGSVTGLHFDYVPAVLDKAVPDKAMPPKGIKWTGQVRGSWRGHMNALRTIIDQNLTSAVIFEDDMDWDIRIKQQMYEYALMTRALTQPLLGTNKFADPTFPIVHDFSLQPQPLDINHLPSTHPPVLTPYGDNWDLLWLGHCGMRRPMTKDIADEFIEVSRDLPKGVVKREHDPTVPKKEHLHWWVDHIYAAFKRDFAEHTRITHHSMDAVCTFAYAVTQAGARKILYELGVRLMNDGFDLMLRDWCNGKRGHEGNGGVCLTVQPPLFSHFIPKPKPPAEAEGGPGNEELDSGFERTKNIRYSTFANLRKLLRGRTDYDDQWPD